MDVIEGKFDDIWLSSGRVAKLLMLGFRPDIKSFLLVSSNIIN